MAHSDEKFQAVLGVVTQAAKNLEFQLQNYENAKRGNSDKLTAALAGLRGYATTGKGDFQGAQESLQKILQNSLVNKGETDPLTGKALNFHESSLYKYRQQFDRPDVKAEDFFYWVKTTRKSIGESMKSIRNALDLNEKESFL